MQPGAFLKDMHRPVERFRVEELFHSGKNYQIALARDVRLDDKLVAIKTIEYDTRHARDPKYVEGRRDALRSELEFLTLPAHLLPEPLDWIEIAEGPVGAGPEPLLVYEFQHGQTLHGLITARHPEGLHPRRALRIFRELVKFAGELHQSSWIFRDFDPRHVIVGHDDIVHVVGCGNAVKRGERMNVFEMNTNHAYTAPEIRRELSGKVVRPACDIYSLGCLLSFMLTGIEPTQRPEAPLDVDAYDRLRQGDGFEGVRLLIARCLQPLAQKRFAKTSELLARCAPGSLPTPATDGFGMMMLPTPWSGPEGVDNRALRSKLSPGPLVSQKSEAPASSAAPVPRAQLPAKAEPQEGALEEKDDRQVTWLTIVLAGAVLSAILFILSVVGIVVMTAMGLL
ncbi:MAG: hypothetical protein AAGI01_03600 [Myxococcota bacterium]